jgi:hypothetical protein
LLALPQQEPPLPLEPLLLGQPLELPPLPLLALELLVLVHLWRLEATLVTLLKLVL